MGRIRGRFIRNQVFEILRKYKDRFTDDFEHNKNELNNLIITSKANRNKIAGFITKLAKQKKIEAFLIENNS